MAKVCRISQKPALHLNKTDKNTLQNHLLLGIRVLNWLGVYSQYDEAPARPLVPLMHYACDFLVRHTDPDSDLA